MIHEYPIFDVDKESKNGRIYTKKLLTGLRKDIKDRYKNGNPYYAVIESDTDSLIRGINLDKIIAPITNAKISKGEFKIEITVDYDEPTPMGELFEKTIADFNPLEYGFAPIGIGKLDENNHITDYSFICANFIMKNPLQNS